MSETAPRRSIDEIIGSIRSIMDRGHGVPANSDSVPDEPTDMPASPVDRVAYAEPTAPSVVPEEVLELPPFAHSGATDPADRERMAEIARTVTQNIVEPAFEPVTPEPVTPEPIAPEPIAPELVASERIVSEPIAPELVAPGRIVSEPVVSEPVAPGAHASVPEGRAPGEPAPSRSFGRRGLPAEEAPIHQRLQNLHETVIAEHTVASRGVTVQAANDPMPGDAPQVVTPMPLPVLPEVTQLPAMPQPDLRAPADPVLDDATLRPIIREWLDDNLPPLVERLVREELQKAIRGKTGDRG